MARSRVHHPLHYRRARSLLFVIGLFWLWLWLGSGALLDGLHHSPVHAALAVYALAIVILVSIPAALLAVIRMILTHPRRTAVVVPLPAARQAPREDAHWWYGEKAS
ncbi:hypothetical protein [Arthrobacter sp. L77]|uniref:hypothetical protein n=1 Tax=Arthrobacter sp. L77 TaxID=1496689 RepID=UPI0012E0BB87|nr:hypothetical protein [Arthrobacter sp. L77]